MKVNERRTVVGGLIGHCVSPNCGERSTRMHISIADDVDLFAEDPVE